jgi:chemotaxis protein MotB
MRGRNLLVATVFGLGLVGAAGCQQGIAKTDYDALKAHDEKVLKENASLATDREQLAAERDRVAAELERLRTQQASAAVAPPISPVPAMKSDLETLKASKLPAGVTPLERDGKAVLRIDGSMVNFGSGKASLTAEGKQAMDKVAMLLNRDFPTRTVIVEGHTDTDPINRTKNLYKNNWELGMKRATEVVDYLTLRGVDASRIRAMSYGEHQPISPDKAKNRRVEIVVTPEGASAASVPTAALTY